MSLQIDFGIVVIILLLIGNEVTSVKRKLKDIEDRLETLCKREDLQESTRGLSGELGDLGKEISSDLKELKEIGDKLESLCKREDLQESVRDLSRELRDLRKEINSDIKHEIEMHEMRTS